MRARIDELIRRFGLGSHVDDLPEALPLGVRQRLSLAVAIIHDPDMLILDEPTSGVDPVARDEFWGLLIDLSRQKQVTIFISTHFMNEAMRCDRISLMHAGVVLACDTPSALVAARGAASLEEAFIGYIADADVAAKGGGEAREEQAPLGAPTPTGAADEHPASHSPLSLGRLLAYSHREALEILRDPVRLAFAFVGSLVLMLAFGFGITTDVEDIRYAALDPDETPESRSYLAEFEGSRTFLRQAPLRSPAETERRLQANEISLAVEIPTRFGRDLSAVPVPRSPRSSTAPTRSGPRRSSSMWAA